MRQINKVFWYFNRASLMSPVEMIYRAREKLFYKFTVKVDSQLFPVRLFKGTSWLVDSVKPQCNENKAEALLSGKYSFFSFKDKLIGSALNWQMDYKSGKQAPLSYGKEIDYRDFDKVGDIKYTWELNRQQHLIELAKAFYITDEKKYRVEVERQIQSWLEQDHYPQGVNWSSSLELSIRLISWSWVWTFFKGKISPDLRDKWLSSIYGHCKFIYDNFSRYSSANNHLIGEAAGLFIASLIWQFDRDSKKWQNTAYKILVKEIDRQNYSDGVNKEQAVSYQQFVLDFFILAGLLGERNGVTFPQEYWERIEKMLEFIASLMDVNGNIPNIGDSDDGYAVILSFDKEFNPYKSLLATGAVLFNRGDFKAKAGEFDEKSFWLLGEAGRKKFDEEIASQRALAMTAEQEGVASAKNLPRNDDKRGLFPSRRDRNDAVKGTLRNDYPEGGYYILSDRRDTQDEILCVFDCGPLGYLSLAAHGHADALSFTLSIGGVEFLTDPGTYAYHTQRQWREYFKGTSAHNTITVDNLSQSVSGGNFMWLKKAQSKLLKFEDTPGYCLVYGEHNGYRRLKDPVIHRREVRLDKLKRTLRIIDEIEARNQHIIEQGFNFDKACEVEEVNKGIWQARNAGQKVVFSFDKAFNTSLYRGSESPKYGWQSKRFDVKDKAVALVNSASINGNCRFETIIEIGGINAN